MKINAKKLSGFVAAMVLSLSLGETAIAAGGGSMNGGSSDMSMPQSTPEERAKQAYNAGIRRLKDAVEYEADAAKASDPKKVAKANDKARKAYERALKEFTRATTEKPTLHEAWNYVGYTQRHLGNYDASLAAYAKALELRPNYPEAIEYRGEAFLGLNAIEDVKQSYLALARMSPPLAADLMKAMQKWVAKQRENPNGVDAQTVQNFESWLQERQAQTEKSASTSDTPRSW
jgi:tetratricopeptide (TPR) repeat protein